MDKPSKEIWIVCKNGNFCAAFSNRDLAIGGLRTLGAAPKAAISEQKDQSVRLEGVAHFRAKKVTVA